MSKKRRSSRRGDPRSPSRVESTLRIIGGHMRGRPVLYSGDERTRPMKQRVREAIFNLLGATVQGTYVLDLFAGTGALAWEALSRGAVGATLIERHFPTLRLVQRNAVALGVSDRIAACGADTFIWSQRDESFQSLPTHSWIIFCSPPYDFYIERSDQMVDLIRCVTDKAPENSQIVVESDPRFDVDRLPHDLTWDIRTYAPAVVSLAQIKRQLTGVPPIGL